MGSTGGITNGNGKDCNLDLLVLEATRGVQDHLLPYWDAQIWATARLNQIPIVFSEDFNAGAVLGGVRFVNPFAGGFQIEEWVA
jgi:predicted nucleic acid-binding protein